MPSDRCEIARVAWPPCQQCSHSASCKDVHRSSSAIVADSGGLTGWVRMQTHGPGAPMQHPLRIPSITLMSRVVSRQGLVLVRAIDKAPIRGPSGVV
ncbi:hypothetical protein LIA77_08425 [Sarocladium implicatum]|nr:hypothetical protein LIA77_08425 [Sarocladium implicatum]